MPLSFRRTSPLLTLDMKSWFCDYVMFFWSDYIHLKKKNQRGCDCLCFRCFVQVCYCQMSISKTQLWCPCDCPTPYPHSLTSISLLVSPQQIRKASQHLHGDRPQSSRWPQCAARQLKRERRAGKRKWVRIRGEQGRQREAASASGLRTNVCTCALADTHTRCVHASVHSSGSSQRKQIPTPRQSRSISSVRVSRGVRATGEVQRSTKTAPESHTPNLCAGEKSEKLPTQLHGQIPQTNQ